MAEINQSVEALTDESGDLVGLIYNIENWGSFSRVDGMWKFASFEGEVESDEDAPEDPTLISTSIDLEKATELVERFDSEENVTEEEIDSKYAISEEENE